MTLFHGFFMLFPYILYHTLIDVLSLRGDAIAHMPQTQRRDLVDHLPWVAQQFQRHRGGALGDEHEPRVGLLEVVLPSSIELSLDNDRNNKLQ